MIKFQFQKLPRMPNEKKKHRLFEYVATHIREQVEIPAYVVNLDRVARLPTSAKTVYWLWRFQCEAGICGMDKFVLDHLGIYSPQIHAALKAVGATELVQLLEEAIPLARNGPAEFKRLPDQSWFKQFPLTGRFAELHLINKPTFALENELSNIVAGFIDLNKAELFEK
jgi:hypothetical protein